MKAIFLSRKLQTGFLALLLTGFLAGCVGVRFDQQALDYAVSLGKDLPALMEKATKPYTENATQADALLAKVNDAYTRANSQSKNKDVAEQWRLLRDDMVQPYLNRWKEKGKLDKDFITPAAKQVKDALASIERAEKAKPK